MLQNRIGAPAVASCLPASRLREGLLNSNDTPQRYGPLLLTLHWLMALQLVAVYACINLADLFPKGSDPRALLKTWHYMLGLSVLAVVVIRIVARWSGTVPAPEPRTPPWQRWLGVLTHLALYALLIAMPVLGWLTLSAAGKEIPFFGMQLPALLGEDHQLAESLEEIHETVGEIGYYLVGLHVVAGLFHHYVARDATLVRMLPFLRSRAASRP